jgi:hypothetical protein
MWRTKEQSETETHQGLQAICHTAGTARTTHHCKSLSLRPSHRKHRGQVREFCRGCPSHILEGRRYHRGAPAVPSPLPPFSSRQFVRINRAQGVGGPLRSLQWPGDRLDKPHIRCL